MLECVDMGRNGICENGRMGVGNRRTSVDCWFLHGTTYPPNYARRSCRELFIRMKGFGVMYSYVHYVLFALMWSCPPYPSFPLSFFSSFRAASFVALLLHLHPRLPNRKQETVKVSNADALVKRSDMRATRTGTDAGYRSQNIDHAGRKMQCYRAAVDRLLHSFLVGDVT